MTDLPTLITRLEAGETGQELDAFLWGVTCGHEVQFVGHQLWDKSLSLMLGVIDPGKHQRNYTAFIQHSPYTTSLDAAIAFTEAVLPGVKIVLADNEDGSCCAALWCLPGDMAYFGPPAFTRPVALVLAALKELKERP